MSDLQIAMRAAKTNRIRALTYGAPLSCSGAWAPRLSTRQSPSPRRFGAFAVLTLRTIEKIRAGRMTASEAARHFEQMARTHRCARPATMTHAG